jgi:small-conductance mechanosensitive channel
VAVLLLQEVFPDGFPEVLENVSFGSVLVTVLVFVAAWLAIRWNSRFFDYLSTRSVRGRYLFKRAEPVIRMLAWFYATYLALTILAPSPSTFFTLIASIGLAIGLGAQDLVKNIIGGIVVLIDRPYQLGDRVRMGDAYGEIDHIGLRSTKLTTPDDTRVTIPNSEVLTGKVYNANSGVPDCQVVTDVIVPHNADPNLLIALGYETAHSSPFLLLDKPVLVLILDQFENRPYTILRVKAYVYDHRSEPQMQSDITTRVKSELLRLGILERCGPAIDPWTAATVTDVRNPAP